MRPLLFWQCELVAYFGHRGCGRKGLLDGLKYINKNGFTMSGSLSLKHEFLILPGRAVAATGSALLRQEARQPTGRASSSHMPFQGSAQSQRFTYIHTLCRTFVGLIPWKPLGAGGHACDVLDIDIYVLRTFDDSIITHIYCYVPWCYFTLLP